MDDLKKKLITGSAMAYSLGRSALYFLESKPLPIIRKLFDSDAELNPPEEFRKVSEVYLRKLLEEDSQNIADGVYPSHVLSFEKPKEHVKRLIKIWSDALFISYRRSKKKHKIFDKKAQKLLPSVPEYYQRNFHNQTNGYLSEKSAEIYDHQVDLLFSGSTDAMRRSLLKPLKKYQQKKSQLKILELGCGSGSFTKFLAKTFPESEITAIDISRPYIKVAQKKLEGYNNINLMCGLAEDLSFKSESFDAVVSVFLFHELPMSVREKVFQESNRVLKPGGFLGLVDSIQKHDNKELSWAIENFPKIFHEPYYKNYINHPIENIMSAQLEVSSVHVANHFLSKSVYLEKSL